MMTTRDDTNFELSVNFRLTPGANSDITYFVDPNLLKVEGSALGLEFQLPDDEQHFYAKLGRDGRPKCEVAMKYGAIDYQPAWGL